MSAIHYPHSKTLLRQLSRELPQITHGKGIYLFDDSGKSYLDASGGALVTTLGHGLETLIDSITHQMKRVSYVNGTQFTTPITEMASQKLSARAQAIGLDQVAYLSSGSEAVEAALKFARQLWVDRGFPAKHKVISRTPGYHGNTLYALSASGRPHYKTLYGPMLATNILNVKTPYGYRCPVDYETQGAEFYAQELERVVLENNPDTIASFIFEPVSGSSTGGWSPPRTYFDRVTEICKKYGILMIADEVLCGSGRTGKFFASEHFGLKPDIAVLGKGLNAGILPVSAFIVKSSAVDTIKNASGNLQHAQTYMHAPMMTATVNAVLDYLTEHHVLENSVAVGNVWRNQLKERLSRHPHVGCVTGIGHLCGVEFVQNKVTREPFPIAKKTALKFAEFALKKGLILWPNYGQADGTNGDLVIMGPSLLMTPTEAQACVQLLDECLQDFFNS